MLQVACVTTMCILYYLLTLLLICLHRLSFNKFANNGGFLGSAIFALPKVKLYSLVASTTLSYCTWDNVKYGTSSLFTIQPARVPFGATPVDGTQYAITNYNANSVVKFTFTGTAVMLCYSTYL